MISGCQTGRCDRAEVSLCKNTVCHRYIKLHMEKLTDDLISKIVGFIPLSEAKVKLKAISSTWLRLLGTAACHQDNVNTDILDVVPPEGGFFAYTTCVPLSVRLPVSHLVIRVWTPKHLAGNELDKYIVAGVDRWRLKILEST